MAAGKSSNYFLDVPKLPHFDFAFVKEKKK